MQIILVRHAKARDRIEALLEKIPDAERPLTKKGIVKFKVHVQSNTKIFVGCEIFACSEYVRAQQTLNVLLETLEQPKESIFKKLIVKKITPDDHPDLFLKWIEKQDAKKIVVVTHEPFISNVLKELFIELKNAQKIKKGCIIVLEKRSAKKQNPRLTHQPQFVLKTVLNPP